MTDIFLDTNVLLDVMGRREPFYDEAMKIWTLCEQGRFRGLVSVISFNNIFYVVRKYGKKAEAYRMLEMMRDVFTPVALDAQIVGQAIGAGFNDFEDAIQYHSALRADAECIITRNGSHFPMSGLNVLTPKEFLATYAAE